MQTAAVVGFFGFAWLTLFQLMLAAGMPLGHMAWGGANRILPRGQRFASLVSAGLAVLALWTLVQAAGWAAGPIPMVWIAPLLWGFAGLFGLSLLLNLFGAKGIERLHGVPLTCLCAGSCLYLALA